MSEVKKAVRQFKRLLGKKPLCFESVADILKNEYDSSVKLCNKEDWKRFAEKNEIAYSHNCLYTRKESGAGFEIFVRDFISEESKLIALLHIMGRLMLFIIYAEKYSLRKRLDYCTIKADAFAYMVLASSSNEY